jgi:hypothetical protein
MGQHSHKFTTADDDAVRVLLAKLVKGSGKQCGARLKPGKLSGQPLKKGPLPKI